MTTTPAEPARRRSTAYLVFTLSVSVLALVLLGIDSTAKLEPSTHQLLGIFDNAVCLLFFIDFLVNLYRADNRAAYFFRWGWIDLLSSVPMVDSLRWARLVRVLRILRVLRGLRATKVLAEFVLLRRERNMVLAPALLTLLLIGVSAMSMLQFETVVGANITSAEDALWWAMTTITTVGYGDRYPVTTEGRVLAGILMTAGVGLFGVFSGFVASWFLRPAGREEQASQDALASEVGALRAEIAALRDMLAPRSAAVEAGSRVE